MQHTKGRASDLTHYGAILRELVMRGHVTFAELTERYPTMQYEGFLQAAKCARRDVCCGMSPRCAASSTCRCPT